MQKQQKSANKKGLKFDKNQEISIVDKIEQLYDREAKKQDEEVKKIIKNSLGDKDYRYFNKAIPYGIKEFTEKVTNDLPMRQKFLQDHNQKKIQKYIEKTRKNENYKINKNHICANEVLFSESPLKNENDYQEVGENGFFNNLALTETNKENLKAFREIQKRFNFRNMEDFPEIE